MRPRPLVPALVLRPSQLTSLPAPHSCPARQSPPAPVPAQLKMNAVVVTCLLLAATLIVNSPPSRSCRWKQSSLWQAEAGPAQVTGNPRNCSVNIEVRKVRPALSPPFTCSRVGRLGGGGAGGAVRETPGRHPRLRGRRTHRPPHRPVLAHHTSPLTQPQRPLPYADRTVANPLARTPLTCF